MKVTFEMSPEEREDIINVFLDLINKNPVNSGDDLIKIIATIISNILHSGEESIMLMCTECVKETLEESPVYQSLIEQYGEKEAWEGSENKKSSIEDSSLVTVDVRESSDEVQKTLDTWNATIKRKEYLLAERKYKS